MNMYCSSKMLKRSGAWFFKGLPQQVLPAPLPISKKELSTTNTPPSTNPSTNQESSIPRKNGGKCNCVLLCGMKYYQYSMTSVLLRIKIFLVENSDHRAVFNVFALGT